MLPYKKAGTSNVQIANVPLYPEVISTKLLIDELPVCDFQFTIFETPIFHCCIALLGLHFHKMILWLSLSRAKFSFPFLQPSYFL